jgi:hypothetical protein
MLKLVIVNPYGVADSSTYSGRKIIDYNDNETPSYVPSHFLDVPAKDEADVHGRLKRPVSEILRFNRDTDDHSELFQLATVVKEDIKNHVEVRLQLFCLQLALVSKTRLVFNNHKTKAQAGVKNKSSPQKNAPSKLHELHASTLPNLKFITSGDASLDATDVFKINMYVFGLDTFFYKKWNATHKLPRFVNDVDSLIDKFLPIPFYDNFRHFCVKIINDVSQGSGIEKGFRCFLFNLNQLISVAQKTSSRKYTTSVLEWYKEVVQIYLSKVNSIIQVLLRCNIENLEPVCTVLQGNFQREVEISRKLAKYQDSPHVVRCAMIAFIGLSQTSKMIEKYINEPKNDVSYSTSGIITKARDLARIPEVSARGKELLAAIHQESDAKGVYVQFQTFLRSHIPSGTHYVPNIVIRTLQIISEQQTEGAHINRFYAYFCINPGKIQVMQDDRQPSSVFHKTLATMRADASFRTTVTDIAALLEAMQPV